MMGRAGVRGMRRFTTAHEAEEPVEGNVGDGKSVRPILLILVGCHDGRNGAVGLGDDQKSITCQGAKKADQPPSF